MVFDMPQSTARNRKSLGYLLVGLQFACMLLLAGLALPVITRSGLPPASLALAGASLVLALWILMHNRLGNFNIQPAPKKLGILVTSGPYRWIRHPMYTTVLLGAAALALVTEPTIGWAVWLCLALVLWVKSRFEEQWMQELHPGYRAYMLHSKRFIPLIF
jgi:protein-S-isoprenylcysteine O-methyltransferase Ste14